MFVFLNVLMALAVVNMDLPQLNHEHDLGRWPPPHFIRPSPPAHWGDQASLKLNWIRKQYWVCIPRSDWFPFHSHSISEYVCYCSSRCSPATRTRPTGSFKNTCSLPPGPSTAPLCGPTRSPSARRQLTLWTAVCGTKRPTDAVPDSYCSTSLSARGRWRGQSSRRMLPAPTWAAQCAKQRNWKWSPFDRAWRSSWSKTSCRGRTWRRRSKV